MKKLIIGYIPISGNLSHPADRRRIVFYAKKKGYHIELDLTKNFDVLVLSERANFVQIITREYKTPIVFDLIDSYLTPISSIEDRLRGISKGLVGQNLYNYMKFSKLVSKVCLSSDAVVCSTIEQARIANVYNLNVHQILDSHSEIPLLKIKNQFALGTNKANILWEGLPYTIRGLNIIKDIENIKINIVTDLNFKRYLGSYINMSTQNYLVKKVKINKNSFEINQWSIESLVSSALKSSIAIIPLNVDNVMNNYKAENRLLIMWRLGLPVLASATLGYSRVINGLNAFGICQNLFEFNKVLMDINRYKEELNHQVQSGREFLKSHHTDEILIDKWDKVMNSVI